MLNKLKYIRKLHKHISVYWKTIINIFCIQKPLDYVEKSTVLN